MELNAEHGSSMLLAAGLLPLAIRITSDLVYCYLAKLESIISLGLLLKHHVLLFYWNILLYAALMQQERF